MDRRKKIIIGLVIFLVLICLTSLVIVIHRETKVFPPPTELTPTPTPIPVKSVMTQTLNYIEGQRLNDGFYNYLAHYNEQCEMKEGQMICPFNGEWTFPQTNGWTSLAYLSGYQVLGEQKYLDSAKRDMDRLILHCESKPEDCLWILVQVAKLYEKTGDSQYLDFLRREGELLLTKSDPNPLLLDIEIRQLAILFGLTKDDRFLNEAKRRLERSEVNSSQEDIIYQVETFAFPKKACWQTLAKVEIGKQTGEKHYFDEVKTFLDQANINTNFGQLPHPIEIQPCLETYFELAGATDEGKYYQEGTVLLSKFIEIFWDGNTAKLIYGEGGTIFNPYPERQTYSQNYVILTDSAYSAYLLSYLQEKE